MYLFNQHERARGWQLALALVDAAAKRQSHPLAATIIQTALNVIK